MLDLRFICAIDKFVALTIERYPFLFWKDICSVLKERPPAKPQTLFTQLVILEISEGKFKFSTSRTFIAVLTTF
jgi:hypothetical protein